VCVGGGGGGYQSTLSSNGAGGGGSGGGLHWVNSISVTPGDIIIQLLLAWVVLEAEGGNNASSGGDSYFQTHRLFARAGGGRGSYILLSWGAGGSYALGDGGGNWW
jgi:hypothetical protein